MVHNLLDAPLLESYRDLYSRFLSNDIDARGHRHDLGSHVQQRTQEENVCQIMWPSEYVEGLLKVFPGGTEERERERERERALFSPLGAY